MKCEAKTAAGNQCPFDTRGRNKLCAIHKRMHSKKVGSPVAGRGELVHTVIPSPTESDNFAEEVIKAVKVGITPVALQYMLDGWRNSV